MFAIRGHARTALLWRAQRCLVVPRAAFHQTPSSFAKSATSAKSTKSAKSVKSAESAESSKPAKSAKSTKSAKPTESAKSAKATKSEPVKAATKPARKRTARSATPKAKDEAKGESLTSETPEANATETKKEAAKSARAAAIEPQNEMATKLAASGTWAGLRGRTSTSNTNTDKHRINIVSEKLCDDVIEYIRPTLARHEGCDLIDIFPGVGLWSRKLHDAVKPRSHILMEPDEDYYRPYLDPLLQQPGTRLLPESGIVWEELNRILNPTVLPNQVERKYGPDETPQRNDTLLVTMNLSMYPKRRFRSFESLASLVLFQIISSIRPGSLFQKYGLVRMLIWAEDSEKASLLPHTIQRRRKSSIEAELSTDYICEVAGCGIANLALKQNSHWFRRDEALDFQSTKNTLQRMREGGFVIPPGREPDHVLQYLELTKLNDSAAIDAAFDPKHSLERPYMAELEALEAAHAAGKLERGSKQHQRWKALRYLRNSINKRSTHVVEYIKEFDAALQAWRDAGSDEARRADALAMFHAWSRKLSASDKMLNSEVMQQRDNLHLFHHNPPLLNWDRRYVEPLQATASEFFPQIPCTLLDIQPKAVAPVLRDMGPNSTRGGDIFDLILRGLSQRSVDGVAKSLDIICAGAGGGIFPLCPSLTDPDKGGYPITGMLGELTPRILSQRQLVEIAEGWMKWPFRPKYSELVCRTIEDFDNDLEEEVMGNLSSSDI